MGYPQGVSRFFPTLIQELVPRRRRLREIFGNRGQAIYEFFVMGGLIVGSLGLFLAPWMPAAAPWGFALPFLYVIGQLLLEWRRQKAIARGADAEAITPGYDWTIILWSLACALAGAAAFVMAWGARPAPPPAPVDDSWRPPENVIEMDLRQTPIPRIDD